jgi:mono/diheme cytochrome c family protein
MLGSVGRSAVLAIASLSVGWLVPVGARAGDDPAGNAQVGKGVFETNCALCHGASGRGDGPGAIALNPKPANFTDRDRMSRSPEPRRLQTVREGGASVGLSPLMPAFKEALSEQQIRDVLEYVKEAFVKPASK